MQKVDYSSSLFSNKIKMVLMQPEKVSHVSKIDLFNWETGKKDLIFKL